MSKPSHNEAKRDARLTALYRAGAELDPANAPKRNTDSYHDAFASLPIVFRRL